MLMWIILIDVLAVALLVGFFFGLNVSGTTFDRLKVLLFMSFNHALVALIIGFFLGEALMFGCWTFQVSFFSASIAVFYKEYLLR